MENEEKKNPLIKYWPQLTACAIFIFSLGVNFNNLEAITTKIFSIEEEHDHDIEYLNEEDNGVRSDFINADACNKEISALQDEVLYWKLKYEFSN